MPKSWITRVLMLGLVAGAVTAVIALLQRERIVDVRTATTAAEGQPYSGFREVLRIGIVGPNDVALSPDGRLLAIASQTGLWLYDLDEPGSLRLASGYELANQPYDYDPPDDISGVAFSPDGQYLAFTSDRVEPDEALIHILDLTSGTVRHAPTPDRFCTWSTSPTYSADGTRLFLAEGTFSEGEVCLWSVETGERELVLGRDEDFRARRAALSPDGRFIVSVSDDGQVRLWDAASGAELGRRAGHDAAFGPDNLLLIANHDAKQVQVLDTPSLNQRLTLEGESAVFSPDGARIATVGAGEIALWSADGVELWRTSLADPARENFTSIIEAMVFSPDGSRILALETDTTGRRVRASVWDAAAGERIWSDEAFERDPFDRDRLMRFDRRILVQDARAVLLGSVERMVVWDFAQESATVVRLPCLSAETFHEPAAVRAAAFSPDAAQIMVGCHRANVLLWEADGSAYRGLPINIAPSSAFPTFIRDVVISPDGAHYLTLDVSAGQTGMAILWDALGEVVVSVPSAEPEFDADISPDGALLAFGSTDGRLELYTVPDGQRRLSLGSPAANPMPVYRVRFSPDGTWLVTLSPDNQARVWATDDGAVVATLPHPQRALAVAFSPDGTRIATGDETGIVRLWSVADGQRQASYRLPTNPGDFPIYDLAFSPDSQYLAVAWQENQVWVLDVNTGTLAGAVGRHMRREIHSVAFSPDGSRILTVSTDGTARVWARR